MRELGPVDYAGAFAACLALSLLLTPLMLRLALRRGIFDAPGDGKSHSSPVPYLGGLAIVAAFSLTITTATALTRSAALVRPVAVIMGVGVGLAVMGLVDDLRGIPWSLRFGAEAAAGIVMHLTGSGVDLAAPAWVRLVVTVLWVVGITNAVNLLDNMDGLSAGVTVIGSVAFFTLAVLNGQYLVAALSAALAGCGLGFLRHNFFPARIYMGDAGSLYLGFLLSVIGIRLRLEQTPPLVAIFVPVLVLGVAIFDTTLVVWNRLRHGRSPFRGGTDHVSHRLVWVGIPVPVAVGLIYLAAVSLGWLAVVLSRVDSATGLLLIGLIALLGTLLLAVLSVVPVYENSRQRQTMLRLVRSHEVERDSEVAAS